MLSKERYWRVTSILATGLLAVAVSLFGLKSSQSTDKIIIFGFLMVISKLQKVPMNGSFLTTDFGFVFAGVAILGPVVTALLKALTTVATELIWDRRDKSQHKYLKAAFNAGQYVLSYFFALGVYTLSNRYSRGQLWWGTPQILGILTYFVANNLFIGFSIYLQRDKAGDHWKRDVLEDAQTYVISVPSGVLATYVYHTQGFFWSMAVFGTYLMASYMYTLYMNLKEKNRELSALLGTSTIMVSSLDYEEVLEKIMISLENLISWDTVCIYVYQKNALVPVIYEGFKDDYFKETKIIPGSYLGGCQLFAKEAVIIDNCDRDPEFKRFPGFPRDTKTLMAIPLFINNELMGGISITSRQPGAYSNRHLYLMSILSNQAAVAISNAKLYSSTSEMAVTDSLTKLYNHRYIYDELRRQVENAFMCNGVFSLIIIDIDRFKTYNDAYGHVIGDTILVNLSEVLKRSVRDLDTIGRYGGEEFCIILPGISSEKAAAIAERIRQNVETTELAKTCEGEAVYITISAGVASYPEDARTAEALVHRADEALVFGAKRKGRNQVVVFSQHTH